MTEQEARKAFDVAKKSLQDGDTPKALRFVQKSIRIFPTEEAQALLIQITNSSRKMSGDKPPTPEDDVNSEDYKICLLILAKKDYYDLLGVTKTATEEDIKSKYKKLALKLHPDKNRCSKATEAFKKISTAYNCLSNKEKRSIYDVHGDDEQFQQKYERGYEEEMSPEDLFNYLFFGAMPNRRMQRRRYEPQPTNRRASKWVAFVQLIPFLLMIGAVMVMNFQHSSNYDEYYSFHKNYLYPIQMTTSSGVTYFVSTSYQMLDIGDRMRINKMVESTYVGNLMQRCRQVKNMMRNLRNLINMAFDSTKSEYIAQYEKMEQNDYTVCKELEKMCDLGLCNN
jgi:DnaJ family protein B protein 12